MSSVASGLAVVGRVLEAEAVTVGNAICGEMERRGHRVLRFATVVHSDGGVANLFFEIDVIGDADFPWIKAFAPSIRTASPDEVEAQLAAWKRSVRGDLTMGRASGVVKAAIKRWGLDRVRGMLGVH